MPPTPLLLVAVSGQLAVLRVDAAAVPQPPTAPTRWSLLRDASIVHSPSRRKSWRSAESTKWSASPRAAEAPRRHEDEQGSVNASSVVRGASLRDSVALHKADQESSGLPAQIYGVYSNTPPEVSKAARDAIQRLGTYQALARLWAVDFLKWLLMVLVAVPITWAALAFGDRLRDVRRQRLRFHSTNANDDDEDQGLEHAVHLASCERAPLLGHLTVSENGGLDRVAELLPEEGDRLRYSVFFLDLLFVLVNMYWLLWMNAVFLQNYLAYKRGTPVTELLPRMQEYHVALNHNHLITVSLTAFVAVVDMLGVAVLLAMLLHKATIFVKYREQFPFDAFRALEKAAEALIMMESFSTLMLIGAVHPALIFRRFHQFMSDPPFGGVFSERYVRICQALFFVASRLCCGMLGLLAFGVKLTLASVQMNSPFLAWWMKACMLGALLCQTMGAVMLDRVLRRELLYAVFGAQDAVVEALMLEVYIARLYERMWTDYWEEGRRLDFVVLAVTLDDSDLRTLVLEKRPSGSPRAKRKA